MSPTPTTPESPGIMKDTDTAFDRCLLNARFRRVRSQLEFVAPTRFVLSVEVIECLSDLNGVNNPIRVLLVSRHGSCAWRVDGAIYYDVGYVYAVLRIFFRQHLGQGAHHHPRIVQRLSGLPFFSAQ